MEKIRNLIVILHSRICNCFVEIYEFYIRKESLRASPFFSIKIVNK